MRGSLRDGIGGATRVYSASTDGERITSGVSDQARFPSRILYKAAAVFRMEARCRRRTGGGCGHAFGIFRSAVRVTFDHRADSNEQPRLGARRTGGWLTVGQGQFDPKATALPDL